MLSSDVEEFFPWLGQLIEAVDDCFRCWGLQAEYFRQVGVWGDVSVLKKQELCGWKVPSFEGEVNCISSFEVLLRQLHAALQEQRDRLEVPVFHCVHQVSVHMLPIHYFLQLLFWNEPPLWRLVVLSSLPPLHPRSCLGTAWAGWPRRGLLASMSGWLRTSQWTSRWCWSSQSPPI